MLVITAIIINAENKDSLTNFELNAITANIIHIHHLAVIHNQIAIHSFRLNFDNLAQIIPADIFVIYAIIIINITAIISKLFKKLAFNQTVQKNIGASIKDTNFIKVSFISCVK